MRALNRSNRIVAHTRIVNVPNRGLFRIVKAYEEGVWLAFGKYQNTKGPGFRLCIPFYHQALVYDKRVFTVDLPKQKLVSKDDVTFHVDATLQYEIEDVTKAALNVYGIDQSIQDRAQISVRNELSNAKIEEMLANRAEIGKKLVGSLEELEESWGVKVHVLEPRNFEFDETMVRAMAKEAEAERSAKAKIIQANADIEVAEKYHEAARFYKDDDVSLKLREINLVQSVAKEPSSKMIFVPTSFFQMFKGDPNLVSDAMDQLMSTAKTLTKYTTSSKKN
jgi:regulator of protease activity HflC (stomatin/prohibitin superfamily)